LIFVLDSSVIGFSGASIVPNNNPSIGMINDIENSEKTTEKKLNNVFKRIRLKYGKENFKILRVFFIVQI
tara:strand:+ start:943 stop:1152 length:210 start_codon:yes stop_codon:yes gene_type:complete